ncbi:MAG: FtsP/CotA-like multicopper oxidase with cupredoxin domain [Rhodothermales bacterium]|jgi:FtsP/CotA-like multicopper oxidase with cupredoxin domain
MRRHLPLTAVLFLATLPVAAQTNPLLIPETLEGPTYNLEMHRTTHEFFDGVATDTYAFNGSYLGPTLILNSGEDIQMNVLNSIGQTTTTHWHGMHVAPMDDGGPHTAFDDGQTWSPDFTVLDRATTFWYHPHLHEHTNEQVYRGLAGMIIVRDKEEAALALPRTYGVDDIPLIIQDRQFSAQRQLVFNLGGPGAGGDEIVINGTVDPYVEVGAQTIRFRALNGSGARVYNLGFEDGRTFHQIGSDGGLLEAPVALTRVRLAPGERAELLLDFSGDNGSTVNLMSFASEFSNGEPGGPAGGPGGPPPAPLDGEDFLLTEIRVSAATSGAVQGMPATLAVLNRLNESDADRTRTMVLGGGEQGEPFNINGLTMNLQVINETVNLGDTEIWELTNRTPIAHPFHIHDIQFFILDRDGAPPAENERGLKDVVLVEPDQTVRFLTVFEDFADPVVPYMYHCHLLGHEDGGMMGQFLVVDPQATTTQAPPELPADVLAAAVYPNPFSTRATVSYSVPDRAPVAIDVYDVLGRHVQRLFQGQRAAGVYEVTWAPSKAPAGTYVIRVVSGTTAVSSVVALSGQ